MDIVYVCRAGENEELRYSLRSLANLPHDRVWIFGAWPEWVRAECVKVPQTGSKYANTTKAVKAACEHPEVSDPFILMNDDFFIMTPIDSMPVLNRGTVREMIASYEMRGINGVYAQGMRATLDLLERHGHRDPLSFELHVPLPVHKAPMLQALEMGAGMRCFHKRTAYGAVAGLSGKRYRDVKVFGGTPPKRDFLSSIESGFVPLHVELYEAFPDPSPYESGEVTVPAYWRVTNIGDRVRVRSGKVFEPGTTQELFSMTREIKTCADLSVVGSDGCPKDVGGATIGPDPDSGGRGMKIEVVNDTDHMVARSNRFFGPHTMKTVEVSESGYREIKACRRLKVTVVPEETPTDTTVTHIELTELKTGEADGIVKTPIEVPADGVERAVSLEGEPLVLPPCPECGAEWVPEYEAPEGEMAPMVQNHAEGCSVPAQIGEQRELKAADAAESTAVDYSELSDADLVAIAKERGVLGKATSRKTIIDKLKAADAA